MLWRVAQGKKVYHLEMVSWYRAESEWVAWRCQRSAVVLVYCITCIVDHIPLAVLPHGTGISRVYDGDQISTA